MDFFDRQEHARKQTRRLIWLFGLAVLAVIVLTYLVLAVIIPFTWFVLAVIIRLFSSLGFTPVFLAISMISRLRRSKTD